MHRIIKDQIDGFEMGHWYVYRGHTRLSGWNDEGLMDLVLDNKPHMCVLGFGRIARFLDERPSLGSRGWNWGNLSEWCEVEAPSKAMKAKQPDSSPSHKIDIKAIRRRLLHTMPYGVAP